MDEREVLSARIEDLRKNVHGCAGNATVSNVAAAPFRYAMDAMYLLDDLFERLAKVERETIERCAEKVEEFFVDERCGIAHLGLGDIRMTAGMQEELAAAIRALSVERPSGERS